MKKLICAILALALLCGAALADIETTGNVNLRKGPGTEYGIVASVMKGTTLHDMKNTVTDIRGVEWYEVEYNGRYCWVSSKYAKRIDNSGYIALEGYYNCNLSWAAGDLGLTKYEYTGGELENCYYSDKLSILGNATVECMSITDNAYSLFGATTGMKWYEALNACVQNNLYVISAYETYIVLEREAQYPNPMKSCINLHLDNNGEVYEISWSTYTSD